ALMLSSSALMRCTTLPYRLISRWLRLPKICVRKLATRPPACPAPAAGADKDGYFTDLPAGCTRKPGFRPASALYASVSADPKPPGERHRRVGCPRLARGESVRRRPGGACAAGAWGPWPSRAGMPLPSRPRPPEGPDGTALGPRKPPDGC